jgi:site-specific recombinase XerD
MKRRDLIIGLPITLLALSGRAFSQSSRKLPVPRPFPHAAAQLRLQTCQRGQDTRAIQHYLGHRSIASTVRYTAFAPDRFKRFWKD